MARKVATRITAKFFGGPRDGESFQPPLSKAPEEMQFSSKLAGGLVHWYERGSRYRTAGYDIYTYQYRGVRAPE